MTDGQLLDRWYQQRDEPAFELLVERYLGIVLGLLRKYGSKEDAESIANGIFAKLAFAEGERRPNPAKVRSWRMRGAHSSCRDRVARAKLCVSASRRKRFRATSRRSHHERSR